MVMVFQSLLNGATARHRHLWRRVVILLYRERCKARLTSEWDAVIALIGSSREFAPLRKRLWG